LSFIKKSEVKTFKVVLQDKQDEIVHVNASIMLGIAKTITSTQMQSLKLTSYPAISTQQAQTWIANLNLVQNLENALFLVVQSEAIR